METYLALASLRAVRAYDGRAVPAEVIERVLDAGRVAGSAGNAQPWELVVLESPDRVREVAATVWEPANLLGAAEVVAVVVRGKGPASFDAGRAAQNMMLAAWDAGVGSCPNGVKDQDGFAALLGLSQDDRAATVLSFGYPSRPSDPRRHSPGEWLQRASRKPGQEVVRRI